MGGVAADTADLRHGKLDRSIIPSCEASSFRDGFNRQHFGFQHHLVNHPSFAVPRLLELYERIQASGQGSALVAWEADQGSPGRKYSQLRKLENIQEAAREIAEGCSLLRLAGAQELDPRYREIHDGILDQASALSGVPLRQKLTWSSMAILLSSPGAVTPYHIDHQSNLLFQIQGEKDIWLFDPMDRNVLTEDEVERYYVGSVNAADYREASQQAARRYRLTSGLGIHNPSLGPHWVKNGPNVSVSVSLNFSLTELEARARVYQTNRYLRRLGFTPRPPGHSFLRDRLKSEAMKLVSKRHPRNLDELLDSMPRRVAGRLREASARSRSAPM